MTVALKHIRFTLPKKHFVPGTTGHDISSFTEFVPFCHKLYFISNYKDFNTLAQA
jgi:hypothetical protein